jgi:hypothetical protein
MIPLAASVIIGEKVLDKVIPDPEAKAKAQATAHGDGPAW